MNKEYKDMKIKISVCFSRSSFLYNIIRVPVRLLIWKLSKEHLKKNGQIYGPVFDYITTEIILDGRFENNLLKCLEFFMLKEEQMDGRRNTCIDIGANIGNHSLFFSRLFKNVISFEPHPTNFKLLAMNVQGRNVEIHNIALSDADTSITLDVNDSFNSGAHRLANEELTEGIHIKAIRLDGFITDDQYIDFMKIDVEGHEVKVLKGAVNTIKRCRPTIVFEQALEKIEYGSCETVALLKEMGYTNFYYLQKRFYYDSMGPFLNIFRSLLVIIFGDRYTFVKLDYTPRRFHDMIIAKW